MADTTGKQVTNAPRRAAKESENSKVEQSAGLMDKVGNDDKIDRGQETVDDAKAKAELKPAPAKVPTLYVRNLNDKLKIEGKFCSFSLRSCLK